MKAFPVRMLACMAVIVTAFAIGAQAQAQDAKKNDTPVVNIRIVDIDAVRAQSKAFVAARDKIVAYGNKRAEELQKDDKEIRDLSAELNRKRTVLSPEAFAQERKGFDEKVANLQRKMQEHQQVINKLQSEVLGKLNEVIVKIITEYARDNNVSIILPSQSVVLSADALSIDAHVLGRLDKELPSVAVNLPAN